LVSNQQAGIFVAVNNPDYYDSGAFGVAKPKCFEWPTLNRRAKYAPLYLIGCAMGWHNTN
jgi:hypothetical protein